MAAFERMEEKVLMQEARAQGAELAGADLESQFAIWNLVAAWMMNWQP